MNKSLLNAIIMNALFMAGGLLVAVNAPSSLGVGLGSAAIGFGLCGLLDAFAIQKLKQKYAKVPASEKFVEDPNAVSPVIGVILMVAITVVLAAIVFVLVSNLATQGPEAPRLSMLADGHGNFAVQHIDADVPWSDLLLGPGATCTAEPSGEFVRAGDIITCTADHLTVVHMPSDSVIYRR